MRVPQFVSSGSTGNGEYPEVVGKFDHTFWLDGREGELSSPVSRGRKCGFGVHHSADTHEDIVIELPAEHLEHPGCIGAVECDFKHSRARGG